MRTVVLIIFLLSFSLLFGQTNNGLKEFGYKGKAKSVTAYYYDTLSFNKTNKILDNSLWSYKLIYTFDTYGRLDTVLSYTQSPMTTEVVSIFKVAYDYSQKTRIAFKLNELNEVTDTIKFVYLNDTTYQTIETAVNGRSKVLSDFFLNKNYREKGGKRTFYDDDNKIEYSEEYENQINKNGLLIRSFKTNLLTNTKVIVTYRFFNFDKFDNPAKVLLFETQGKKASRIVLRKFKYY